MSARGKAAGRKGKRQRRTVGLVVEGETEFRALPVLMKLPGCPALKPINLGGVGGDVTAAGVARRARPQVVTHIVAGRKTVVVCIDREKREACAGEFAQAVARALEGELESAGGAARWGEYQVSVVVADRSFEAWLLADARGLHQRKVFRQAPKFHGFEGARGKQGRLGVVEIGELWGRAYDKAGDGRELFDKVSFKQARVPGEGSRSLDKLLRTLGI